MSGFAGSAIGAVGGLAASDVSVQLGGTGYGDGITELQLVRAAISAAAGCAGSAAVGGKCAPAAVTAAFASLYNGESQERHEEEKQRVAQLLRSKGLLVKTEVGLHMLNTEYSTRIDLLVMIPDKPLSIRGLEIKTGESPSLTDAQEWVYPAMVHGGLVVGIDKSITSFGLTQGAPLPKIPVYILYRPSPTYYGTMTAVPPVFPYKWGPGK